MNMCEVTRGSAGAATGEEKTERDETETALIDSMENRDREKRCCTKLKAKLSHFDKYVFSPLFIKDEDKMTKRSGRLEDPNLKYQDD